MPDVSNQASERNKIGMCPYSQRHFQEDKSEREGHTKNPVRGELWLVVPSWPLIKKRYGPSLKVMILMTMSMVKAFS